MTKIKSEKPRPSIYPVPTLLLTCDDGEKTNIITISWTGILCSQPPIISVSVQPHRHSYNLIMTQKKFTVNIPSTSILYETDVCGTKSGKNTEKDVLCNFHLTKLEESYPKAIEECSHHLMCDVIGTKDWGGTHTVFFAEVKHEYINEDCYLGNNEYVYDKISPIAYCRKNYYKLEKIPIGFYGYSLKNNT